MRSPNNNNGNITPASGTSNATDQACPDQLLSRQQVAELLHIIPKTLSVNRDKWASVLPIVKVSRLARYRRSDVEKLIKSGSFPSSSTKGEANG